jgi:Tol biopolymer transport system component
MIAFQRTTDGGGTAQHPLSNGTIWVMTADGSAQRQVTAGAWDQHLAWSRDGSRVAFQRTTFDPKQPQAGSGTGILSAISSSIYEINADGSGLVKLADQRESPAFFPTGSMIAFASTGIAAAAAAMRTVQLQPRDLRDAQRRVRADPPHSQPGRGSKSAWTPDGRAIVFSSDRANYPALTYQGVDSDLYIIPGTGGCR